jgi:hypothetical protein
MPCAGVDKMTSNSSLRAGCNLPGFSGHYQLELVVSKTNWAKFILPICVPLLGGCVLLPTQFERCESGPRGLKLGEVEPMIVNGKTTRLQLQEKLGSGFDLANGKLWLYTFWESSDLDMLFAAVSLVGGGAKVVGFQSDTYRHLLLEFDDTGVVRRHRVRRGGTINASATGWDEVFQ